MTGGPSRWLSTVAAAVGLVLVAALATPVMAAAAVPATKAPLLERDSSVITADPLPTVQIDSGYVWAQTTVGDTVYAAGSFSNARAALAAPGTSLTPRSNILAFDITSGALESFAPSVNGVIKSIAHSVDGSRVYIGGSFTQVNGQARWGFAALDAKTGELVDGFKPSVGGAGVYGIAVTADTVYVAGAFTQANGVARKNFAAFATSDGALRNWAPTSDLQADALIVEPGGQHIIAGGRFYYVNDVVQRGLVALDPATGAIDTSWQAPNTIKNGGIAGTSNAGKSGIFGLSSDATGVYGTGWVYSNAANGNLEGAFAAEAGSGDIRWVADCHGDNYGVYSTGKTVYTTSHTHACETVNLWPEQRTRTWRYMLAFTASAGGTLTRSQTTGSDYADWSGTPSPSAYPVTPDFTVGTASGLGQAGLSITGAGDYVAVAGEFTSVNNKRYQGIVRFSTNPAGGAKDGPRLSGTTWAAPTASASVPGRVRVSVGTNWDRDNRDLTYQLLRSDSTAPLDFVKASSLWWNPGTVVLNDTTVATGQSYTYTVRAVDGDGNAVTSAPVTATASSGSSSDYADGVLNDRAELYYPLGDIRTDWAGGAAPVLGSGVTRTAPGAVAGVTGDYSSKFSGSTSGRVSSGASSVGDDDYAAEAWFKTTTTRGGKIFGFGSSKTSSSGTNDRNVYMLNNGRVSYGVYPGTTKVVTSEKSYNDGQWHHVVSTLSAAGMTLYIDGQPVAQDTSVVAAQNFTGYWRVGYDNLSGWPNRPSSAAFSGSIDEFAVYPTALSAGQVAAHYAAGIGFHAPTASFTSTVTDLATSVDATASSADPGQTITGYSWSFGDGSTGTGVTAAHAYTAPGTYEVTLTVTDSRGIIGVSTQQVAVLAPNVLPTAEFTATASGLTVSVDAAASADTDGTIASYSWNWGDGSADGSGAAAAHSYAKAGTYAITLTTIDDRGGQATRTTDVEVTHDAPVASFNVTGDQLKVSVDGTASTASDAATMSWSWNWGDGTAAGAGATATHSYTEAGDYTITLTVTDSAGATAEVSRSISVADQAYAIRDDFERAETSGWGTAGSGGDYTMMAGSTSVASIAGGQARLALPAGQTRNMALKSTSVADSLTTVTYSLDQAPATGGSYVGISARKSATAEYLARVWMRNDGKLWLVAQQGSTVLATQPLPVTWAADDVFRLAVQVTGSSPATIRMKTWKDGADEPAAWQLTATDSTAALQTDGWTSVHASRGSTATSAATFSFDSLRVTDLNPPAPPANTVPTAAFTSTHEDLTASVDATTSTDSDGTIASYSWAWGDGSAAGSGATASHTYTAAGSYDVTLTVTDDDGASSSVTHQVTVTDPPLDPAIARDAFSRTASSGWGTADVGGTWTLSGGAASAASVADGTGVLTLGAGSTRNLQLSAVSAKNVTMSIDFSADAVPATGSTYLGLIARSSTTGNYLVRAWLNANGTTSIVLQKGSTVLVSKQIAGLVRAAGDTFTLKVDVVGDASTTISAKLWKKGSDEPSSWQATATDAAGIDAAGAVGVNASRSASATSGAVVSVDDFRVVDNG